jgi:hypothetical protein
MKNIAIIAAVVCGAALAVAAREFLHSIGIW